MTLTWQRLVEIERELALGRREGPEAMLSRLFDEIPSADLEVESDFVFGLLSRFAPKRRDRLLYKFKKACPNLSDRTDSASPGALRMDWASMNDELVGFSELEDGRICCWEIPRFRESVRDHATALEMIREQVIVHRKAGDTLGAGEWSLAKLFYVAASDVNEVVVETLAAWGSPRGAVHQFDDLDSLIQERAIFVESDLATALGAMCLRFRDRRVPLPPLVHDLAFKLKEALATTLGIHAARKKDLCPGAAAAVSTARAALEAAVDSFTATTPGTAKDASIELLKRARAFQRLALVAERPLLTEIPLLVGVEFRRLCEDYQRRNTDGILHRVPGVRKHATALLGRADNWSGSQLWYDVVQVVTDKVLDLADDVVESTQAATLPHLRLVSALYKVDLTKRDRPLMITGRLRNSGPGRATEVELSDLGNDAQVSLRVVEPKDPFDVSGQSEQRVRIEVAVSGDVDSVRVPIQWRCTTRTGVVEIQEDAVELIQQIQQPDWDKLRDYPPYSHNAIKEREGLFGRDDILQRLELNSMAGNSCFVWGQKRIGKTSVLQVLAGELRKRANVACVYLRMGEVKGLHEGQLAHRVAERLANEMDLPSASIPEDEHFGASMAQLIPWVERVVRDRPDWRLILIIDEFDDLDSAYYTGTRGEVFAKQLRSLSEVGLTFLLIGSERMEKIYRRHENELNKWTNEYLDSIESRNDCRELVMKPVTRHIEFDESAVEDVVDYCGRNPFYMHLLCYALFQLCMSEQKTYVGITDVAEARERIMRTSGESNFAHYWSDNPTLDETEHGKLAAETCLALAVIGRGGRFERIEDVLEGQIEIGLSASEQLPRADIDRIVSLLLKRRVLTRDSSDGYEIALPILREWLGREAETVLLPKWRSYCAKRRAQEESGIEAERRHVPVWAPTLPVSDDDLIAVAQRLTYLGRQLDVAQLRSWLLQFDDEIRIELAYLLLRRLAEVGYVSDGAYAQKILSLEEAVADKRRSTGRGVWKELRRRRDNLAIAYVDGGLKSGVTLTRELRNRLRPGKSGPLKSMGAWLRRQVDQDALLLVADDFAATGNSLVKGIGAACDQYGEQLAPFFKERRILCYTLYAMPEALDQLRERFPDLEVNCMKCFGDEVRALSPDSGIFGDYAEVQFVREMVLQLGRELVRQSPLGFGDMGLLVAFSNTIPNNTLPIFWSNGSVAEKPWKPLFPRP